MKLKNKSIYLSIFLVLLLSITLSACDSNEVFDPNNAVGSEGLEYFPVTAEEYGVKMGDAEYLDVIVIPSVHEGKKVTQILEEGFLNADNLKSISIPSTVTKIGKRAFNSCNALESITFEKNSRLETIGDEAFENCNHLTEMTIPKGVTEIGEIAFSGCYSLERFIVEDGNTIYTEINDCLIEKASKTLVRASKSSKIPTDGSVTKIGDYAFAGFSEMTNVQIPTCITSIGKEAFSGCLSLKELEIPTSVTSIGEDALLLCDNLQTLSLPIVQGSDGDICDQLFGSIFGPDSLKTVNVTAGTKIGNRAFDGCYNLTNITIADTVTSIGENAFYNCSSLKSITIPKSVKTIGPHAFSYCRALTNVTFEDDGVTTIEGWAFYGCTSLVSVKLPNTLKILQKDVFQDCDALESLYLPKSLESIGLFGLGMNAIDVYYSGTEREWNAIDVEEPHYTIDDIKVHYSYVY